ncbi:MAG: Trm112 family protein [Pseudomonadota bacterium]
MMSETPPENSADPSTASEDTTASRQIDPHLLELLVCPQSKGPLVYDRENNELLSKQAGLAYPIRDGVPIMLIDEARPITDTEIAKL